MNRERIFNQPETFVYNGDYNLKKSLENWVRLVVEDDEMLLSGTPFNVASSTAQFIELSRAGRKDDYLEIFKSDLEGYISEFSLNLPIIPYNVSVSLNSETLLTSHYITGELVPVLSLLNPNERGGAVVRRTELLGKLLSNAKVGDFLVATSPDGWHGLTDEKANAYTEYNHTQTSFFEVLPGGNIRAHTIRSSMTQSQNEVLLSRISNGAYVAKGEKAHMIERIIDVVDTVVAAPNVKSINDLIEIISEIRGGDCFWRNTKYTGEHVKDWRSHEVFKNIDTANLLTNLGQDLSPILEHFWRKVQNDVKGESVDDIRMFTKHLRDAVLESSFTARKRHSKEDIIYSPATELEFAQGQAGCVAYAQSEFGFRTLSATAETLGINYPFNVVGEQCRLKEKCLSGNNGQGHSLAVCRFCLHCDIGLRTGRIKISDIPNEDNKPIEGEKGGETPRFEDALVETAGKLIISIFTTEETKQVKKAA